MRYLIGEIALYAAICLAAVVGLFVWRSTPVVAILLGLFLAGLVGWGGYRIEKELRPESSQLRRVVVAALTLVGLGLAAYVLWVSVCSCT